MSMRSSSAAAIKVGFISGQASGCIGARDHTGLQRFAEIKIAEATVGQVWSGSRPQSPRLPSAVGQQARCLSGGSGLELVVGPEHAADAANGPADAVLILNQGEAHVVVAVLAETDARRDTHLGFGQQLLGELQRTRCA